VVPSAARKQEVKVAGRKKRFPGISADEALAALRWLHSVGKVSALEISGALKKREDLVRQIRAKLEELGGQGLRFLARTQASRKRVPAKRRRRKASAKAQAAWRAQGRYLAAVRPLSKANRLKIKKVREARGVGAAVAAARRLARKG
jgi:hypothetical protein